MLQEVEQLRAPSSLYNISTDDICTQLHLNEADWSHIPENPGWWSSAMQCSPHYFPNWWIFRTLTEPICNKSLDTITGAAFSCSASNNDGTSANWNDLQCTIADRFQPWNYKLERRCIHPVYVKQNNSLFRKYCKRRSCIIRYSGYVLLHP